nr:hypothetical protein [Tanacetum cinerariifolium]
MLAVRDVDEEEEAQVPAQGNDVQEPAAEEVATDVVPPTSTSPSPSSPVIPSSPPHQPPCPPQPQDAEGSSLLFQRVVAASTPIPAAKPKNLTITAVFNQGRVIVDMDQDEGIELVLSMQEDDTEVQEAVKVVTTAKLMTEVVTAVATQVVAASTPIPAAKPKNLTITAAPAKKDRIELDVEYARKLQEEMNKEHEETYKNIDWNAALDHVQSKEPQYIKRYHGIKKKPQTKSEARKNMISYLKNTEGHKMDFFKGKKYDEILLIFQAKFDANMMFLFKSREEMKKEDEEIIKSINETPAQKAAKRRKLSEEAQEADDLKKRLEIVVVIDNKPKYKIIRADDTHQFYISFTTLLKNFDREDLEALWKILFLLVERRYPLSRFTLEQLVNVARLQVEEESEGGDTPAETPKVKDKGKGILIEAPKPMKKKDQIEMDAEFARKLQEEINKEHEESYKNIDWNAALNHVQSKEPQYIKRYHGMKKKPQTESEARKNMIFYLRNTEVEKRYPLSNFTLEQLVNVVRLKVEEESEISLELLRIGIPTLVVMYLSCLLEEQLLEPALNLSVHSCGREVRVLNCYDQKSLLVH